MLYMKPAPLVIVDQICDICFLQVYEISEISVPAILYDI